MLALLSVYEYMVDVYTGGESVGSGDLMAHITLIGGRGDSGPRRLLRAQRAAKFTPGEVRACAGGCHTFNTRLNIQRSKMLSTFAICYGLWVR